MITEIEALLEQSKQERVKRNIDGLKLAEKAYDMSCRAGNTELQIAAFRERIAYHYKLTSNYAEAERLCRHLQTMIDEESYPEVMGVTCNILGVCNDVKGDYVESRNCYLQTIDILEGRPGVSREGKISLANAYYNLCKLYQQIEVEDRHMDYLDKAMEIFEAENENDGIARVWNIRAAMLPQGTPVEERLELFRKAQQYYVQGNDEHGYGLCLSNIGLCHCHMGNFDEGIEDMIAALNTITKSNSAPMISFAQFQIAEGFRMKGDSVSAIVYLEMAEKTLLDSGAKVYLNVIYQEWATCLASIGDYKQAYEKMWKHVEQVSDRIDFDRQAVAAQARLKFELEKKQKESELLRRKNEEIELFNQRLQQSNAELNQFAYAASHDLKEPLRMVSNYMQLLEKSFGKELTEDQALYMKYASDGAKRMYTLIDSLLIFSRATSDTAFREINLNDVVEEVTRTVVPASSRPVHINCGALPVVLADYTQMIQVFQNLVANAVKYNDKADVSIDISYEADGDMHRITVADNGIGIEPRYREKVFELFKRLHHRDAYSGTGIGLSICKKIIHQMDGRIWIEDSPLGGAAFVFTLPAA